MVLHILSLDELNLAKDVCLDHDYVPFRPQLNHKLQNEFLRMQHDEQAHFIKTDDKNDFQGYGSDLNM